MADFFVNEARSTLHTTDSKALLDPQVLDLIVEAVLQRLMDRQESQRAGEMARRLRQSVLDMGSEG
jgi:hypothetical protein